MQKLARPNLASGISYNSQGVVNAFSAAAAKSIEKLQEYHDDFYGVGVYLVNGFAKGISDRAWYAAAQAASMARAASQAARDNLQINSPSRVFMEIGGYVAEGFAIGIGNKTNEAVSATSDMADDAISTMKKSIATIADVIDSGLDTQPTIRPILDLSDVRAGTSKLQALFSRNQAVAVSAGIRQSTRSETPTDDTVTKAGNTYQFTQNNYSPKALTRDEIYRQTKNQFSAMERMVEA